MKSIVFLGIGVVAAICLAQQQPKTGLAKPQQKTTAVSSGPVTEREARIVFGKVDSFLLPVVGKMSLEPASMHDSSSPATRDSVARQLWQIFVAAKPHFKFTPNKVAFDRKLLKIDDSEDLANLETLISWGCVAKIGPLAVGPQRSMSIKEFGDAVGFFMARIAQLTHMPQSRWTPMLNDGTGS